MQLNFYTKNKRSLRLLYIYLNFPFITAVEKHIWRKTGGYLKCSKHTNFKTIIDKSHSILTRHTTTTVRYKQFIQIHDLCNENQLDTLFKLNLFRQPTSTCFGHIYCLSRGIQCITRTNCCTHTVNTSWWWEINMPETCTGSLTK
jgi:hypothetical protein